jgi:hypothetical protein
VQIENVFDGDRDGDFGIGHIKESSYPLHAGPARSGYRGIRADVGTRPTRVR